MVHEQAVFQVLSGIGEVQPEQLHLATLAVEACRRGDADQVAAEVTAMCLNVASLPTLARCAEAWIASSSQSCSEITVSLAPSRTSISMFCASTAEPDVVNDHHGLGVGFGDQHQVAGCCLGGGAGVGQRDAVSPLEFAGNGEHLGLG